MSGPAAPPAGTLAPAAAVSTVLTGSVGAIPLRTAAVLEAITRAILTGELPPGRSLVETELAAALGVSKTPVREALKTLAGTGLVTMSPYRGATVRAIDDTAARQIYDMRLLLEPEAVRRAVAAPSSADHGAADHGAADHGAADHGAADHGPGGMLAAAGEALERADAAPDQAARSLANREFHRALYLDCGNPLLTAALDNLRDQTALISVAAWQRAPSWRQEAGEHRAILAAAADGDAERAAGLLAAHISTFAARRFPGWGE